MLQPNAIGTVTSYMTRSIRFHRLLGLDRPETPDEGHVDAFSGRRHAQLRDPDGVPVDLYASL